MPVPQVTTNDFAPFTVYKNCESVDHSNWVKNENAINALPGKLANYRGYFGLAMSMTSASDSTWVKLGDRLFVPNSQIDWVTLIDVMRADGRIARWGTIRPMTLRYGMPTLQQHSVAARSWDLAIPPFDSAAIRYPSGEKELWPTLETLSPGSFPQLFRVFNQLNRAMTSAARVDAGQVRKYIYGEHQTENLPEPEIWMPQPYVAFKRDFRGQVFDYLTRTQSGIPQNLSKAFAAALPLGLEYRSTFAGRVTNIRVDAQRYGNAINVTLSGDRGEYRTISFCANTASLAFRVGARFDAGVVIGRENLGVPLPENWFSFDLNAQAEIAMTISKLEPGLLRFWFERQGLDLQHDTIHWPASLVSPVAFSHGIDAGLFWDMGNVTTYFHDNSDSVLFPPVRIKTFTGNFPGDIAYDLTPVGPLFRE